MSIQEIVGAKIDKAASSLNKFSINLNDGRGLLLEAGENNDGFLINFNLVDGASLPQLSEAVCTVDWTWIENSTVESVKSSNNSIEFKLSPAGPLVIGLGAWEGKPFLSFRPYRPAKK